MAKLSGNNSTTSLITLIKNEIKNIMNLLNGKSSISHNHDDRYYTEGEVNNLLNGKSNTNHSHSYLPLSGGTMNKNVDIHLQDSSGINSAIIISACDGSTYHSKLSGGEFYVYDNDDNTTIVPSNIILTSDGVTHRIKNDCGEMCIDTSGNDIRITTGRNGSSYDADIYLFNTNRILMYKRNNTIDPFLIASQPAFADDNNIEKDEMRLFYNGFKNMCYDSPPLIFLEAINYNYDSSGRLFNRIFGSLSISNSDIYPTGYTRTSSSSSYTYTNLNLGTNSNGNKFNNIYAVNGTIQTSDRNEKNTIEDIDIRKALDFILGLIPKTYKMNAGTSDRIHWGLISQDIEELLEQLGMTSLDFAGFIKSPNLNYGKETIEMDDYDDKGKRIKKEVPNENKDREFFYSLRYDEFIAPMIKVIQHLYQKNQDRDERINTLENRVASLESRLETIEKLINIAK